MAYRLKNLMVDRVDLVDVGANLDKRTGDGAHIMLFKRASEAAVTIQLKRSAIERIVAKVKQLQGSADLLAKADRMARTFGDVLAASEAREALGELWDLYYAFQEACCSILDSDEADKIGLINASAADFLSALISALPMAIDSEEGDAAVGKVGRKISAPRMKQLREMHEKLGSLLAEVSEGDVTMSKTVVQTPEEIAAAEIEKRANDAIAKAVETAIAKERTEADARMAAELAKRDAEITKAQTEAKTERDLRVLKSFHELAVGPLAGLALQLVAKAAGEKTDVEVFKALSEKAPEEWQRVEAILKAAAEAVRASALFEEQGSESRTTAGSALAQIEALAADLVAKGLEKTQQAAIAKVAADPKNGALYARYRDEQRGRAN